MRNSQNILFASILSISFLGPSEETSFKLLLLQHFFRYLPAGWDKSSKEKLYYNSSARKKDTSKAAELRPQDDIKSQNHFTIEEKLT
jgi:hypothetical protein